MFSLIITIVSIALVVALVAATMYHGGDTLTQGRTTADAAAFLTGAEQIAGAFKMYEALQGVKPNSTQVLIDGAFLKSNPPGMELVVPGMMDNFPPYVRSTDFKNLALCQALDKDAGRTPETALTAYPSDTQMEQWKPYGCYNTTGGAKFYFKV